MIEYEKLKALIEDSVEDIEKFDKGNKAAGTRVRKMMQDIKDQAQEVRKAILRIRENDKPFVT